jgi:diguanylate cyclase (GGDEF)-like protein
MRSDPLTGLAPWQDRDRTAGYEGCLLLVDLDAFRARVNEPAGHDAGDRAIAAAGRAVAACAAAPGVAVYRHGGDSFIVTGIAKPDAALALATAIRQAIERDLAGFGRVTASVGIAHAVGRAGDLEMGVAASRALSEAKRDRTGVAVRQASPDDRPDDGDSA